MCRVCIEDTLSIAIAYNVAMAERSSFTERRVSRVQRMFLRRGMCSRRVLLPDGVTTMHCWIPPSPTSSTSSGPPVVFVHGFGWDGMMTWEMQVEAFMDAGFSVYMPDLVFFGKSWSESGMRSVAFQAECLVALLHQLGLLQSRHRVHVVGTSYGGLVALHLASTYPALVHKVVIASSGICMDAADGAAVLKKLNVDDMVNFLLPTTVDGIKQVFKFLLSNPPRLPDSVYEELLEVMYLKNRDVKVELFAEGAFGTDKALSQPTLTQEVLLVWGENDRLFDTHQGWKLKKHLGGTTQLVIIKGAGHTPESEAPRAFNNAVLAFLQAESLHQSRL